MVEAVNRAGGNARLTLLEDAGHNAWDYAFGCRELFDWMLKQTRPAQTGTDATDYADIVRFG